MSNYELSTLEKLQADVLQGDLSMNPYLQPSQIPARDKELKTTAKKIIPAINELLKLLSACKESVETYSSQIETKVRAVVAELEITLKREYAEEVNNRFETLEAAISQQITQVIEQKIAAGEIGAGAGGSSMKKVFISKVTLETGKSTLAPFKFSELQDINQQITATAYSSKSKGHIMIHPLFEFNSSTTSVYNTYNYPIGVRVNQETDEITLVNETTLYPITLYFFNMV